MASRWFQGAFFYVLVMFTACAPVSEEPLDAGFDVVARVDGVALAASELRDFATRMPRGLRSEQGGTAAREEYLRGLLAKHLIYLEARVWELDEAQEVQDQLEARWRQHIVEVYHSEQPPVQVEVAEEELRRYFEENHLGRQRQLAGILVEEEALAREVLKRLAAGEAFEDLARQHSVHQGSAAQGGVWGGISLQQARRLKIPDEVFLELPLGTLSEILPINKRYLIMRFLQDQSVSLEEQRSRIQPLLYEKKLEEAKREKVLSLAREFGWRTEAAGLHLLLERAIAYPAVHRRHFSVGEAEQPLFTYQGGQITLGEYVDALWKNAGRALSGWGVGDSTAVSEAAAAMILEPAMELEAAKRAGIPQRPEEQAWLEQTRQEIIIRQFRREEVVNKAVVSEEEARDFYQAHEDLYRKSDQFDLVEALVGTEEEARTLLAELDQGDETLSTLALKHTIRSGAQEEPGKVHLHGRDRYIYPQLYKAVQEAEIGEIVGPVQVKGGYSLFRVLHREEGELSPFSRVERQVRSLIRRQKEDQLFEELVDALLEKYQDRIAVYQDELEAALPDTLLQRLIAEDRS